MILGTYREKVSFDEFLAPNSKRFFKKRCNRFVSHHMDTCGTGALSTLTGLTPSFVAAMRPKRSRFWTDWQAIKFLQKHNYKVQPLSQRGITNLSVMGRDWTHLPIKENHVLLVGPLVCRWEATWGIITQGMWFHNFEYEKLNPMFLINKPIQDAYLIFHSSWR